MKTINESDKKLIEEAVQRAEKNTSGEIVPVLVESSGLYPQAFWRSTYLGCLLGLCVALPFYLSKTGDWQSLYSIEIFLGVILGSLVGHFLCYIPRIKKLFIYPHEMAKEVHSAANHSFLHNNVHHTRDHTGILIYLSLFERRVEVIADQGINKMVAQDTWSSLVKNLLMKAKSENLTLGLTEAIGVCGDILAKNFPIKTDDTNELNNNLRNS